MCVSHVCVCDTHSFRSGVGVKHHPHHQHPPRLLAWQSISRPRVQPVTGCHQCQLVTHNRHQPISKTCQLLSESDGESDLCFSLHSAKNITFCSGYYVTRTRTCVLVFHVPEHKPEHQSEHDSVRRNKISTFLPTLTRRRLIFLSRTKMPSSRSSFETPPNPRSASLARLIGFPLAGIAS